MPDDVRDTLDYANGFIDTGSFLVGRDGLQIMTRTVLFGEDPITFLGLTQVPDVIFPAVKRRTVTLFQLGLLDR